MRKWLTKCSVNILASWTPGVSRKQNLQPKGMCIVDEEKGIGLLGLAPGGYKSRELGLRKSSIWEQECDERSTSSPFLCLLDQAKQNLQRKVTI